MLEIIILAIIQGISEFVPISSSAHLIIFRDIFLIGKNTISPDVALTFDIALHLGSLMAIVVAFYKDFINILKIKKDYSTFLNIVIATIPAAIFGVLFEELIDNYIRKRYLLISISLIVVGIVIYFVDRNSKESKKIEDITAFDSFLVGVSQIFALIPGFSRSGTTISALRFLKVNREDSTKFSFFLAFPVILGAFVFQLIKIDYEIIFLNYYSLVIGTLVSFVIGLFCIKLLLRYVKSNNFKIFMFYRIIFGFIIMVYLLFNSI